MSENIISSLISNRNTTKNSSMSGKALSGVGSLLKLLPTGTVFLFLYLSPVFTNNGHCYTVNKYFSAILLVVCGFNCVFSSFTDSYTGSDGQRHYAIVTAKGLWPSPASENVNLSAYKLRFGDVVHGFFTLLVFAVLGLLNPNIVRCFYPEFESYGKVLLMEVLPPVIGAVAGVVFMIFPSNRHGIGYPTSTDPNDTTGNSHKK